MSWSRSTFGFGLAVFFAGTAVLAAPPDQNPEPTVLVLETMKGVIEIELFPGDAPKSVEHVVALVKRNFYRGHRFHWVEAGVVQFGDPQTKDMTTQAQWGTGGSDRGAVGVAETSERAFTRGIVGLAYRTNQAPTAADSQIFILRFPNPNLNGKYAIIGRVIAGLDVLDEIEMTDRIRNVTIKDGGS